MDKDWAYLKSEAFQTRMTLAVHFLAGRQHIVEIGGFGSSLGTYAQLRPAKITNIDPRFSDTSAEGDIRNLPLTIQEYQPVGDEDAVVILGLALPEDAIPTLIKLIDRVGFAVIEYSTSVDRSHETMRQILATGRYQVRYHASIDLDGNDFGDLKNSWPVLPKREVFVLERFNGSPDSQRKNETWLAYLQKIDRQPPRSYSLGEVAFMFYRDFRFITRTWITRRKVEGLRPRKA